MSKAPFKLRSGNSPLFKHMGSSPAKHMRTFGEITSQEEIDAVTAHNAAHKNEAKVNKNTPKKTTPKKTEEPTTSGKVSYADAYAKRDMDLYGDLDLTAYTAEAKRQTASEKAGKGWDAPTKPMTSTSTNPNEPSSEMGGMELWAGHPNTSGTAKLDATGENWIPNSNTPDKSTVASDETSKPKAYTRKERNEYKKALKNLGFSRKERKIEMLTMKAETALSEGKTKKAKRLAKRANRKIRGKNVRTTDAYVGEASDKLIDLGLG